MYWNTWKTKVKITKDPEWSWSEDKSHYLEPWVQPCIFQFQFYLLILFASQSHTLPFCFWDASELIQFIFAPLLQGRAASTSTWNYHCPAWVRLLLLCFLLFVRFCTTSPNCTSFWALKTERCRSRSLASGVVLKPWPNPCLHVWSQQSQRRQLQPAAPIPPIPLVLTLDIRYQLAGCSYHIVRVLRLTESIRLNEVIICQWRDQAGICHSSVKNSSHSVLQVQNATLSSCTQSHHTLSRAVTLMKVQESWTIRAAWLVEASSGQTAFVAMRGSTILTTAKGSAIRLSILVSIDNAHDPRCYPFNLIPSFTSSPTVFEQNVYRTENWDKSWRILETQQHHAHRIAKKLGQHCSSVGGWGISWVIMALIKWIANVFVQMVSKLLSVAMLYSSLAPRS